MNLAEQLGPVLGDEAPTSPLSLYFDGIITALLQFTERADNEANCRTSAYEAISTLAMYSANVRDIFIKNDHKLIYIHIGLHPYGSKNCPDRFRSIGDHDGHGKPNPRC